MKYVLALEDAAADIEDGKRFYDMQDAGVGEYFVSCILSDIESLALYAGIHVRQFGFFRALSKRFPFAIY